MIRTSREVPERRAETQFGFKKLAYPHFSGDVLIYVELKKQWAAKFVPERKRPALEIVALSQERL